VFQQGSDVPRVVLLKILGFHDTQGLWTPKPLKNEGFRPQNMGEITPKNEGYGFPWGEL